MFTCECKRPRGLGGDSWTWCVGRQGQAAQTLVPIIFKFTHSIGISSHTSATLCLYTLLCEGDAMFLLGGKILHLLNICQQGLSLFWPWMEVGWVGLPWRIYTLRAFHGDATICYVLANLRSPSAGVEILQIPKQHLLAFLQFLAVCGWLLAVAWVLRSLEKNAVYHCLLLTYSGTCCCSRIPLPV